jgi:hypothetical protein
MASVWRPAQAPKRSALLSSLFAFLRIYPVRLTILFKESRVATSDADIANQLKQNKSPAQIEADLIGQGWNRAAAHEAVDDALEDTVRAYSKAGTIDLYIGAPLTILGLIGVLFVLSVTFSAGELSGKVLRAQVAAWLGLAGGITELVRSYRNLRKARQLEETHKHWQQQYAPLAQLAQSQSPPVAQPAPAKAQSPPVAQIAPAKVQAADQGQITAQPKGQRPLLLKEASRPPEVRRTSASRPVLAPWMVLAGIGAVGFIVLMAVLIGLMSFRNRAEIDQVVDHGGGGPPDQGNVDPNAPDPNEGPPPKGWTVLFRASDPGLWNTDSPGAEFAVRVRRAHSAIRFLRLTRNDTGETLIVPITHKQLALSDRPTPGEGHWWIGTARAEYGARHLGIAQIPAATDSAPDVIGLLLAEGNCYSGSGFGWKTFKGDRQYYCWQGKEIPRTVFEIAVTADPLTEPEKKRFTGPDDGPAPKGWTVLFRADDPALWNTFSAGEAFAVPVGQAHRAIHHLRLTRMDTGESVILRIKRDQLGWEPRPVPEKTWSWNGAAKPEYGGGHLGIIDGQRLAWPNLPNDIAIMNDGWDGFRGSGFGHKMNVAGQQHYAWQGKEIPRTPFEIAVTASPLTPEETKRRLR